jgi:hypothetical protein
MEVERLVELIFREITYIQELSGRTVPAGPNGSLVPLRQCEGFDSVNGAEVAIRLETVLDLKLSENPFVDGRNPLTLEQTAKKIIEKHAGRKDDGKEK